MSRYKGNDYEIIAERMRKAEERRARRRSRGARFGSVEKPRAATMSAPDRSEADRAVQSAMLGRKIDQWLDDIDVTHTEELNYLESTILKERLK